MLLKSRRQVFSGGIDNKIRCWDLRLAQEAAMAEVGAAEPEPVFELVGHADTITGISLSPDGTQLLSNAMDSTARVWDVRPFVAGGDEARCTTVLAGHQHNFEKLLLKASWSPDGVQQCLSTTPPIYLTSGWMLQGRWLESVHLTAWCVFTTL